MAGDRKSLVLTGDQWQRLDELAYVTGSVARAGPRVGLPGWRSLIRQLADEGEIIVCAPGELNDAGTVLVMRINRE